MSPAHQRLAFRLFLISIATFATGMAVVVHDVWSVVICGFLTVLQIYQVIREARRSAEVDPPR